MQKSKCEDSLGRLAVTTEKACRIRCYHTFIDPQIGAIQMPTERIPIYLDHAATTAVTEAALAEMLPYFRSEFGNASAIYNYGQTAKNAVEHCRERMAKAIGAMRSEIYFTSGGTESDNWAIRGVCRMKQQKGRHIISSAIEHNAVRRTLEQLQQDGFEVTFLQPDSLGHITPEQLEAAIRPDTILVSIMLANNVVGTILNIRELAATAHRHHILFHTDAVQAVGHIPISVRELGVDFLSMSAHKFGGPKGVGALFCRIPYRLPPLLTGGGQEKEGRSGTENVPGIVGMTAALEQSVSDMEKNTAHLRSLQAVLTDALLQIPGVSLTGDPDRRLPGFCSFIVDGIPHSVFLVNDLNEKGICVSSGSACSASSREASHVLMAMGYSKHSSGQTLRITLGQENTREEVDTVIRAIYESVKKVRSLRVPAYE